MQTLFSATSGRSLLLAMLALLVCDVIGGFVARSYGADSWNEAWGFNTKHTVPLPIAAVQLVLAWLAAANVRPPVGRISAVLLAAFCLISVVAGLFDGDLISNLKHDGLFSRGVVWGIVLLSITAVVGVLAMIRAQHMRTPR